MNIGGDASQAARHIEEAMKLEADGYAHLFQIRMTPKDNPEVLLSLTSMKQYFWQGYNFESYGIGLTDYKKESSGEVSRPKLTLFNPEGVFSRYVHAGWMDSAEITRYRVLREHLEANVNSFLKNTWRVGKVLSLSRSVAVLELREVMDWQFFTLPGRTFMPPDFPAVSL